MPMLFRDLGMALSLPYNFCTDFIDMVLNPFADITEEVYLSMHWRLAVDPKVLMIARESNRRPQILRQLKAMGFRIKMIPQDNCVPYCPVLAEHLNREGVQAIAKVLLGLQTKEKFGLQVLLNSPELKKAFKRRVVVKLERKALTAR